MAFNFYNVANNTTGEIVKQLGADLDNDANAIIDNTPSGHTAYIGGPQDDPALVYYVGGVLTARPAFSTVGSWNTTTIAANGVAAATFSSGLPNPTEILVFVPIGRGLDLPGPITETSGSFSLTTTVPGTYTVFFTAFPYVGTSQDIIAT